MNDCVYKNIKIMATVSIVALVASTPACSSEVTEKKESIRCSVADNAGTKYVVEVKSNEDGIQEFRYGSGTKAGRTCEISARRDGASAYGVLSRWVEGSGGYEVTIFTNNDELASINIEGFRDRYTLEINHFDLYEFCAPGGILAPKITVMNTTDTCKVEK